MSTIRARLPLVAIKVAWATAMYVVCIIVGAIAGAPYNP